METADHNPVERCTAGERYEAMVPDTLDLADRMGLAINALTNVWYPDKKWAVGFNVSFGCRPAVRYSSPGTVLDAFLAIRPKFIESMALCRLGSGCEDNLDVDKHVINAHADCIGEDGRDEIGLYFDSGIQLGVPVRPLHEVDCRREHKHRHSKRDAVPNRQAPPECAHSVARYARMTYPTPRTV